MSRNRANRTEQSPSQPTDPIEHRSFGLSVRRTLAVAVLGTLGLSAWATARHGDIEGLGMTVRDDIEHPAKLTVNVSGDHSGPIPDLSVSDRYTGKSTRTIVRQANGVLGWQESGGQASSGVDTTLEQDAPMPWALEFSSDPQAENTYEADDAIDDFVNHLARLKQQGYKIESISVEGFASDEDNQPGGGLGEPNPLNVQLANTRARAVAGITDYRLSGVGIDKKVSITKGHEVIDKKLDKKIEELAPGGDEAVLALVQRFNRDRASLTPAQLKVLEGLSADRFVRLTAVVDKESPLQTVVTRVTTPEDSGSLKIIPFIIPIPRRKRRYEARKNPRKLTGQTFPRPRSDMKPREFVGQTAYIHKQPRPFSRAAWRNGAGRHVGNSHTRIGGRMPRSRGGDKF